MHEKWTLPGKLLFYNNEGPKFVEEGEFAETVRTFLNPTLVLHSVRLRYVMTRRDREWRSVVRIYLHKTVGRMWASTCRDNCRSARHYRQCSGVDSRRCPGYTWLSPAHTHTLAVSHSHILGHHTAVDHRYLHHRYHHYHQHLNAGSENASAARKDGEREREREREQWREHFR